MIISWRVLLLTACIAVLTIHPSTACAADEKGDVIAAPVAIDQLPADITPAPAPPKQYGWMATVVLIAMTVVATLLFIARRWHRLPREPQRPQLFTPPVGFALYVAIYLASALGATIAARWFAEGAEQASYTFQQEAMVRAGGYAAQAVIISIYAWLVFSSARGTATSDQKRPCRWRAVLYGAGALLLFVPAALTIGGIVVAIQELFNSAPPPMVAHETLQRMLDHPLDGWFFFTTALVLIAAPVAEEVLYRGVFQETLRRLNAPAWTSIILTSAFFALMHVNIAQPNAAASMIASLFVLSIGFGWIYEKTGRLTAPIVMHMLFNAGNLIAAMLLTQRY